MSIKSWFRRRRKTKGQCPVCGRHVFTESHEICPVCGWEEDRVQREDPDFAGGANKLSLNEARMVWNDKVRNGVDYGKETK